MKQEIVEYGRPENSFDLKQLQDMVDVIYSKIPDQEPYDWTYAPADNFVATAIALQEINDALDAIKGKYIVADCKGYYPCSDCTQHTVSNTRYSSNGEGCNNCTSDYTSHDWYDSGSCLTYGSCQKDGHCPNLCASN